ncbi:MAG: hypothetical protein KDM91_20470, partial [Verrucomicrobiae bacterium]|nr:hypothetical protein [Verrucomicrobiae bacterium]
MKTDTSAPQGFDEDRLMRLAHAAFDGEATQADQRELGEMLAGSESARALYVAWSQLHTALESDETLRELLAAPGRPENVVPMPGARPV